MYRINVLWNIYTRYYIGKTIQQIPNYVNNSLVNILPKGLPLLPGHKLKSLSSHEISQLNNPSQQLDFKFERCTSSLAKTRSWLSNYQSLSNSSRNVEGLKHIGKRQSKYLMQINNDIKSSLGISQRNHDINKTQYNSKQQRRNCDIYFPESLKVNELYVLPMQHRLQNISSNALSLLINDFQVYNHLCFLKQLFFIGDQQSWQPLRDWIKNHLCASNSTLAFSISHGIEENNSHRGLKTSNTILYRMCESISNNWVSFLENSHVASDTLMAIHSNQIQSGSYSKTIKDFCNVSVNLDAPDRDSRNDSVESTESVVLEVLSRLHVTCRYRSPLSQLFPSAMLEKSILKNGSYYGFFDFLLCLQCMKWIADITWKEGISATNGRVYGRTEISQYRLYADLNLLSNKGISFICSKANTAVPETASSNLVSLKDSLLICKRYLPELLHVSRTLFQFFVSNIMNRWESFYIDLSQSLKVNKVVGIITQIQQSQHDMLNDIYECIDPILIVTRVLVHNVITTLELFNHLLILWKELVYTFASSQDLITNDFMVTQLISFADKVHEVELHLTEYNESKAKFIELLYGLVNQTVKDKDLKIVPVHISSSLITTYKLLLNTLDW